MSALRLLAHATFKHGMRPCARGLHISAVHHSEAGGFSNILADSPTPAVQVKTITNEGIELADGLILPGASIFLDGKVFLWEVPETRWEGWDKKHFEIFDVVVPKPGTYVRRVSGQSAYAFYRVIDHWHWEEGRICATQAPTVPHIARHTDRRHGHSTCLVLLSPNTYSFADTVECVFYLQSPC